MTLQKLNWRSFSAARKTYQASPQLSAEKCVILSPYRLEAIQQPQKYQGLFSDFVRLVLHIVKAGGVLFGLLIFLFELPMLYAYLLFEQVNDLPDDGYRGLVEVYVFFGRE